MARLRQFFANPWVKWLSPLVILGLVLWLFRDQLHFIGEGAAVLRDANPVGIVLAIVFIVASFFAMAEVMHRLLGAGGTFISRVDTTALTFASNAWSASFPGGPAFSAVLTFQVQRKWGASVILCSWFFVLSSALSTMWLVVLGIAGVFFLGANISLWSLGITLVFMLVLSWAVYWAASHPKQLRTWAKTLIPKVNRLFKRDPQAGVEPVVRHITQMDTVSLTLGQFGTISLWSLLNRIFDIATLWACVWAVTGSVPVLTPEADNTTVVGVLLAYVTAKIAGSVQATPGGLGPVEAALIATLVATGMTVVDATGAVIIYRLISLALMTVAGWLVYFLYFVRRGFSARQDSSDTESAENSSSDDAVEPGGQPGAAAGTGSDEPAAAIDSKNHSPKEQS